MISCDYIIYSMSVGYLTYLMITDLRVTDSADYATENCRAVFRTIE